MFCFFLLADFSMVIQETTSNNITGYETGIRQCLLAEQYIKTYIELILFNNTYIYIYIRNLIVCYPFITLWNWFWPRNILRNISSFLYFLPFNPITCIILLLYLTVIFFSIPVLALRKGFITKWTINMKIINKIVFVFCFFSFLEIYV